MELKKVPSAEMTHQCCDAHFYSLEYVKWHSYLLHLLFRKANNDRYDPSHDMQDPHL